MDSVVTPMGEPRSIADRLRHELTSIRKELVEEVARIPEDGFTWAPAEGMKPYRDLLLEIGTMERESATFLSTGRVPEWQPMWDSLAERAQSPSSLMKAMEADRADILRYLDEADDERFRTTLPIPQDWHELFGAPALEPEEMLRWIARHEYYHLGQIITYNWIRGDNPYKRGAASGQGSSG